VQSKREEQTTCEVSMMSTSESQTWSQNHPYINSVFKDTTSTTKHWEWFLLNGFKTGNHKIFREVLVKLTVTHYVISRFNHVKRAQQNQIDILYQVKFKYYPPHTSSPEVLNEDYVSIFHIPHVFLNVKPISLI
jgi:hypothetical protein